MKLLKGMNDMRWSKVIERLQDEAKKRYKDVGEGKYPLQTAQTVMGAAEILMALSYALLDGLDEDH
jgi:hypothetical protein